MIAELQPGNAADVNILGIGGARMHADLAADDDPGIGLAHDLQRRSLGRVFAHPGADRRGAAAKRQKPPGLGNHRPVAGGVGDLLGRHALLLGRGENAERDHVAIAWRVGDVAGGQERRRRKEAAHAAEVVDALRRNIGPGGLVGRPQCGLLPGRVANEIVPGDVFVDHRARRRVGGHVVDEARAHDPDPAPVAQRLPVIRPCPHVLTLLGCHRAGKCTAHRGAGQTPRARPSRVGASAGAARARYHARQHREQFIHFEGLVDARTVGKFGGHRVGTIPGDKDERHVAPG